jgi:hypothetical protein
MIKIFIDKKWRGFFSWLSKINLVEITDSLEDCDFILIGLQINVSKLEDIPSLIEDSIKLYEKYYYKIVAILNAVWETRIINSYPRKDYEVDKNIKEYLHKNITYFTCLDMFGDNIVFFPASPTPKDIIKQPAGYYKVYFDNKSNYYNKVYFRGQLSHTDRNKVISKLQSYNDNRFDVKSIDVRIYGKEPIPDKHYKMYIEELKKSDIALFIRGDRDMCYNFWDYLRCNVIPCFYGNSSYKNLGFEKIGYKFEDLFIYIERDEIEVMHGKLSNILNDKDLILRMKSKLNDFYNKHIVSCPLYKNAIDNDVTCHSPFLIAKLHEIKNNNYKLVDNRYFSSEVDNLL